MEKKVKPIKKEGKEISKVEHYANYKGHPMVRLKGNFYGGGFNLSKNKMIAILDNAEELKKFAAGKYDKEILELNEDEILEL